MFIENKFFYISLPRCASTSFMGACVKHGLKINHVNSEFDIQNQMNKYNFSKDDIDFDNFQKYFTHPHEKLSKLREKFGNNFDAISVKRNKYKRFYSVWQHILHEMHLKEHIDTFEKCSNLTLDDLLFYKNFNLLDENHVENIVNIFVEKYELKHITQKGRNMLSILVKPMSHLHENDQNIIWFDFDRLYELEYWVSNKLNMDFKLLKTNSSKSYEPNFIFDDYFKERYDSIYFIYDEQKIKKTLL